MKKNTRGKTKLLAAPSGGVSSMNSPESPGESGGGASFWWRARGAERSLHVKVCFYFDPGDERTITNDIQIWKKLVGSLLSYRPLCRDVLSTVWLSSTIKSLQVRLVHSWDSLKLQLVKTAPLFGLQVLLYFWSTETIKVNFYLFIEKIIFCPFPVESPQ